jgi:putative transposase
MKYRAYKYRLYPNDEQKVLIAKHLGSCRFIYNYALAKKVKAFQTDKTNLSRFDIQAELPDMKKSKEYCWLKEVNSLSLQASLANLDSAYTKFFREYKGFPKFKSKKDSKQSFSIPQNTKVDFENGRVFIPKFKGGIKARLHRTFEGIVKTSTITRTTTGKYFISILVEVNELDVSMKPICESKAVGIDLGIKTFAVLSDGTEIPNHKYLKQSLDKVKRLQRSLSHKTKGSKNRDKARRKLALAHEKVTNQRNDFLHKVTKYLVSNYDTICLEDLNVKGMVKNHHLAQALSDIAIGTFNTILEYKAKESGVNILRIGRFEPSSKMCTCGYINSNLTLAMREWVCPECGTIHDRDLLAANNIKRFAFRNINTVGATEIYACGDMSEITRSAQEACDFSRGWLTEKIIDFKANLY